MVAVLSVNVSLVLYTMCHEVTDGVEDAMMLKSSCCLR